MKINSRKSILKYCLQNGGHFVQSLISQKYNYAVFFIQFGILNSVQLTNVCCHPIHVYYRQVSNIRHTLGNKIVDHSDVVGASPVGAAPTTSSFST